MNMPSRVTIVVPVFNSESTLPALVDTIFASVKGVIHVDIVLVDDGSSDRSWGVIKQLAASHESVLGISLAKNCGQHVALLVGILNAEGDIIATLDDDLQYDPSDIPKLVEYLENNNCDVVYGIPREYALPPTRKLLSACARWVIQKMTGLPKGIKFSSLRAFRTGIRSHFSQVNGSSISIDVILAWGARRYGSVEVSHHPRNSGESSYNLRRLARHAVDIMTSLSTKPLRIATYLGAGIVLAAIGVQVWVLANYFVSESQPSGFPFLVSLICLVSGAQLVLLGVVGEYVGRMAERSLGRPAFVIRDTTN